MPESEKKLDVHQAMIAEMCKEIYKENMGHYRYFGTLRARIAYAPATIALTAVAAFGASTGNYFWPMIFFRDNSFLDIQNEFRAAETAEKMQQHLQVFTREMAPDLSRRICRFSEFK